MHNSKDQIGTQIKTEESNKQYQKQLEDRVEKQQETIKLLLAVIDLIHFVSNDMYFCTDVMMMNKNLGYTIESTDKTGNPKKIPKHMHKLFKSLKYQLIENLPFLYESEDKIASCSIKVVQSRKEHEALYELTRKIYRLVNDDCLSLDVVKQLYSEWEIANGGKNRAEQQ